MLIKIIVIIVCMITKIMHLLHNITRIQWIPCFSNLINSLLNSLRSKCLDKNIWILDIGAIALMCSNLTLMVNLKPVTRYTPIFLPDGSIKPVTYTGLIKLNLISTLNDVLHVHDFKCNLLSMKCLDATAQIVFKFYSTHCLLHDLKTFKTVA